MKTLLSCIILSVLFLGTGTIQAQKTENDAKSLSATKEADALKNENGLLLQTSKTMQMPPADAGNIVKVIKVIVSLSGEKITAVPENRETAMKGGDDEK